MATSKHSSKGAQAFIAVRVTLLVLVMIMLSLAVVLVRSSLQRQALPDGQSALAAANTLASSTPASQPVSPATAAPALLSDQKEAAPPEYQPVENETFPGVAILSAGESGYSHLFVFSPALGTLTRATYGDWDDIAPAVSPDGSLLAFASNRSGSWDLYVMSLEDGSVLPLTNTPEYESSPSWSPDGRWLAYEALTPDEQGGNLDVFIRPLDGSQAPIQLTDEPAADFSPAWSPQGRKIAFVSTRTGNLEIWQADLDQPANMFTNLSLQPDENASHPAWSPDGKRLAWSSSSEAGVEQIRIWNEEAAGEEPAVLQSGSWAVWISQGQMILTAYETPNQTYLTGYRVSDHAAVLPLIAVSGEIEGLSWRNAPLTRKFRTAIAQVSQVTPQPLWLMHSQGRGEEIRSAVVPLEGVQAPLPMLQEQAETAYGALRSRVADEVGWDFLSVLEQAYAPLTEQLEPGYLEDWLYTGRAFQFNTAPLQAGWLVLIKENYGADTYWRVYLRARLQDGSQGRPLPACPFDITARHSGEPRAYEQGGKLSRVIPGGYWVDFTRLAYSYGWERVPSLSTWRNTYSGIRYNEYVLRDGLDWLQAMLQVYPRAALETPTPVSSPTMTLTPTATATVTATATRTPYLSPTASATLARWATATPGAPPAQP